MTKPVIVVSREEMSSVIKSELDELEAHAKQLLATVEVLKRTLSVDSNMAVLKETSELSHSLKTVNVQRSLNNVRKSISGRVKTLLREYEK
jgi:hypothetical protein